MVKSAHALEAPNNMIQYLLYLFYKQKETVSDALLPSSTKVTKVVA